MSVSRRPDDFNDDNTRRLMVSPNIEPVLQGLFEYQTLYKLAFLFLLLEAQEERVRS